MEQLKKLIIKINDHEIRKSIFEKFNHFEENYIVFILFAGGNKDKAFQAFLNKLTLKELKELSLLEKT